MKLNQSKAAKIAQINSKKGDIQLGYFMKTKMNVTIENKHKLCEFKNIFN